MMELKILNKKAIKEILALIEKQWDAKPDLDFAFLRDNKDKIYLANKEFAQIDLTKLRVHSIGMYFGLITNNELRLSIEGSQLIGPKAKLSKKGLQNSKNSGKKNIIELDEKQTRQWLKGEDISAENKEETFVILKHKNDFLGTGKYKENKVLNFVPKERRLKLS
jgi:NOL1/NOP2/fmu family ribosome biogenesis protein